MDVSQQLPGGDPEGSCDPLPCGAGRLVDAALGAVDGRRRDAGLRGELLDGDVPLPADAPDRVRCVHGRQPTGQISTSQIGSDDASHSALATIAPGWPRRDYAASGE